MTHMPEEELDGGLRAVLIETYTKLRERTLRDVRSAPPGRERNRPCSCGSGLKTKACAPAHPPTAAELDALREDAELEDARRAPGYAKRSRQKLQDVITITSILNGGHSW